MFAVMFNHKGIFIRALQIQLQFIRITIHYQCVIVGTANIFGFIPGKITREGATDQAIEANNYNEKLLSITPF